MEFCPKCGGIMVPVSPSELKCRRCGYVIKKDEPMREEDLVIKKTITHGPKSKTYVVGGEEDFKTMPTTTVVCPKCGFREAYYWQVQTRSADEPSTTFFRCRKCGYTWREY